MVPLLLETVPEIFIAPFEFVKVVLPFPLEILPETEIPLEPEFVISVLPAPKFFIVPATFTPPLVP
ncbi:unknown [Clostridium sp. CAG:967]|nr:unknown [Clostridium sp. CAG:967]